MKTIDRYIIYHIVGGTLLALAVLVALFAIITFIDDLGLIGRGRYGLHDAIALTILALPRLVFALLPLATVIGALIGLGTLTVSSEISVIRAAGVSVGRLVVAALKGALLLAVIAAVFGEVIAPYCERIAQTRHTTALEGSMLQENELWIRDGRSFINLTRVLPNYHIEGMFIYEFDAERTLRTATYAQWAHYRDGAWGLESVRRSDISTHGVEQHVTENMEWRSGFKPELLEIVSVRLESLPVLGLMRYIDYLKNNRVDAAEYELALWTKILYPLAIGVMVILAVPLVLGRLGEGGIGPRIVVGCLIAVVFHVFNEVCGKVGIVYGVNPLLSATTPVLLFLVVGLWLLHRVD